MQTKPSAKILEAMEIIGSPERWTKNTFARDSDGNGINLRNSDAVCFCSVGALDKVEADIKTKNYVTNAVPIRNKEEHFYGVIDFNDAGRTKHNDVMNMFMTAAFLALSEGK